MESKHSRPTHASFRAHRRQVAWQIILPVILAALLIVAAAVLVSLAAADGTGDIARWAEISTIWLVIPFIFIGLLVLALLIALAYLTGLAADFIPPYSRKVQVFFSQVEAGVVRGAGFAHRPLSIFPELGHQIGKAIRKSRRG